MIAGVIRAGVDNGDFPAELDVQLAASALFGVGLVIAVNWLMFQPERPIGGVEESLRVIVSKGGRGPMMVDAMTGVRYAS